MAEQPTVINKRADVLEKISELYPLLTDEDRKIADKFHKMAVEWDMKIGIDNIRANAAKTKMNYSIVYSAKKPFNRRIFVFKISVTKGQPNAEFAVKPVLQNIDRYRPIIGACPDNIKNVIKNIKSCTHAKCGHGCVQKNSYTFDGVVYNPCRSAEASYKNLLADEWEIIERLVIEEYNAHAML